MDCSDHFAVGTHLRSDVIGARAGLGLQVNDGDLPAFAIKTENVGLATTAFAQVAQGRLAKPGLEVVPVVVGQQRLDPVVQAIPVGLLPA